jgi:hypothetical protein
VHRSLWEPRKLGIALAESASIDLHSAVYNRDLHPLIVGLPVPLEGGIQSPAMSTL